MIRLKGRFVNDYIESISVDTGLIFLKSRTKSHIRIMIAQDENHAKEVKEAKEVKNE